MFDVWVVLGSLSVSLGKLKTNKRSPMLEKVRFVQEEKIKVKIKKIYFNSQMQVFCILLTSILASLSEKRRRKRNKNYY